MKKYITVFLIAVACNSNVNAHCQMPCGIYDDQMIYDQVDQYYETMFKGVSALKNSAFSTLDERNKFIRWVMMKNKLSDETAHTLCEYFLQQKIKPSFDKDTQELVHVLHNLLFLTVQIKQTVDLDIVEQFGKEWEHFKYLFHPEADCEQTKQLTPGWTDEDEQKFQKKSKSAFSS